MPITLSMTILMFVYGQMVPFDQKVINAFYQLLNIEDNDDIRYVRDKLDLNEVLRAIGRPRAEWTFNSSDSVTLKAWDLNQSKKMWLHFISAKLMLVSHFSGTIKKQAIQLYAIISRKSINVGKVIMDSTMHCFWVSPMDLYTHHWSAAYAKMSESFGV